MKLLIVYTVLFCLLPIGASAQKTLLLSGEIKDTNGMPVSLAMVVIEGTTKGVYASNQGTYSLNVSSGKHTILVSAIGFKSEEATLEITNNTKKDFILQELAVELQEVSVHRKTQSQKLRESNFTVNAIEIKNLASSINNLNSTLGRSSGIKIRENGGVGSDFDLSINGLYGNSIRYFIDGVPLSSMGNGISLANLPVNIVERIEVYKGVVPADLGSDALGGAINVITKRNKQNYLDASYGIGSFGTHKANVNAHYNNKQTGLFIEPTLSFNFSKNNYEMRDVETKDSDGRFVTINTDRFHSGYLSFLSQLKAGVINKKWADLFSVSTSYFHSDKELQTGLKQTEVRGCVRRSNKSFNVSGQYQKNNFLLKGLSASLSLSHTLDYMVLTDTAFRQYYWDGSYILAKGNERNGGAKSIRHEDRPLTIGRANLNYSINHNHSININYLLDHLTNNRYDDLDNGFEPSKDILAKQIIGISYNQNFWKDALSNTFFAKNYNSYLEIGQQDLYWLTGSDEVAGSASANNRGYGLSTRLRIVEQLSFKASYEHSVRLPTAKEYLGDGINSYPNFKLKPENSENINLGIFGTTRIASKHNLFYEAGIFYRKVKDFIYLVPEGGKYGTFYSNISNVTVKGIEGEIRYRYKTLFQVIANISYLDERNKTRYQLNGKPEITYNNHVPNKPWLYGNVDISFTKKDFCGLENSKLKLDYIFQYVHWFYFTWEGYGYEPGKSRIPTQNLNNAQITYSLKNERYNLSLECINLFDYTLYDNYMLQKPGRSFFLKLRIFIN